MEGVGDFSLITEGYICTKCAKDLSQTRLPMYSVAMIDFGLMSRHIPKQLHPIGMILITRHWSLAITLKLSCGGSGPDCMIEYCTSFAHKGPGSFLTVLPSIDNDFSTALLLHSWVGVTCQKMLQHSCAMYHHLMFDQSLLLCS